MYIEKLIQILNDSNEDSMVQCEVGLKMTTFKCTIYVFFLFRRSIKGNMMF
jgi:hypothetical protein